MPAAVSSLGTLDGEPLASFSTQERSFPPGCSALCQFLHHPCSDLYPHGAQGANGDQVGMATVSPGQHTELLILLQRASQHCMGWREPSPCTLSPGVAAIEK